MGQQLSLQIGLDVISSYKRLAYTPWHAIAEFVDNSTQSYFDNRAVLDNAYGRDGEKLRVSISYDKDAANGFLRIADNSIGMSFPDLERALHVALPPNNVTGRSKYGMGLKTAACWIGNRWTVKTKKLGESVEYQVVVDVEKIAKGDGDLEYKEIKGRPAEIHYTLLEITDHNQKFQGRTLGKIKDFLSSMYREDFRHGFLILEWQGIPLKWDELDSKMLVDRSGQIYKKKFEFQVDSKKIHGWVGILARGSRADAGFSIIHYGRMVKGWPESWRPSSLYGQLLGSNDLVNQRLIGEIHLDEFDVSHTKDDILWLGSEEEEVEEQLLVHCGDYKEAAKKHRKGDDDERGPTEKEIDVALDELKKELTSPEMVDLITIDVIPSAEVVAESIRKIAASVTTRAETFRTTIDSLTVKGYLASDMSPNDPYVVVDSARSSEVIVIINLAHPHWPQLKGSDGVANYLRHCTYDAIAEWQARHKASRIDPDTIKILKDKLLRVPFEIEMHSGQADL